VTAAAHEPTEQSLGALIDSSVWIALEKSEITEQSLVESTGNLPIYICAVVVAELKQGVALASAPLLRKRREDMLARVLLSPSITLDNAVALQWGAIAAHLQMQNTSRHRSQDIWLAAAAMAHRLRLVTLNGRDFADIPGLDLSQPKRTLRQ
jgi:tRNA(fMet)-specific endonuclease VapC